MPVNSSLEIGMLVLGKVFNEAWPQFLPVHNRNNYSILPYTSTHYIYIDLTVGWGGLCSTTSKYTVAASKSTS